jgi:hypothetical protein
LTRKRCAAGEIVTAWEPEYPNDTALAYKRGFLAGCEMGGLTALPDDLLSHAIDRALGASWPALQAGKAFAEVFFGLGKRAKVRNGGLLNPGAYLLATFEAELGKHKGNL